MTPNNDDRLEVAALCAFNLLYTSKSVCDELLRRYGSLKEAWGELTSHKTAAEGWFPRRLLQKVEGGVLDKANAELDKADSNGVTLLPCWDPRYPHLLLSIVNPPPLLYILGELDTLNTQSVAVVGSRTSSFYGKKVAGRVASALAQNGYTVVSGFAKGIDSEAHIACLDSGGKTVAVLGGSVLNVYPAVNKKLVGAVTENGALISEFPLNSTPLRFHFPRRNRIISGLSLATIVVEAGRKSGALITATWAAEQGREVLSVPGPIDSGYSTGCHQLLREGATLLESYSDIEEVIGGIKKLFLQAQNSKEAPVIPDPLPAKPLLDPREARKKLFLDTIGLKGMTLDSLEQQTGIGVDIALPLLMEMELEGSVLRKPGGVYSKK